MSSIFILGHNLFWLLLWLKYLSMTAIGQVLRIEEINFIRCLILFSDKSVAEFYILFDFEDFVLTHLPLVTFFFLVSSTDSNNLKKPVQL